MEMDDDVEIVEATETPQNLKEQVCELANCLLKVENMWMSVISRETVSNAERDKRYATHQDLSARIIMPLIDIDQEAAFSLSEAYRDFKSLVNLCLLEYEQSEKLQRRGKVVVQYVKEQQRMLKYIKRFGREFAFTLYDAFLERGMLRNLMDQDDSCDQLLDEYLKMDGGKVPQVAWLQDIKLEKYDGAAATLWGLVGMEKTLAGKTNALSIAKLAHLAACGGEVSPDEDEFMFMISQTQDLILLQEKLYTDYTSVSRVNTPDSIILSQNPTLMGKYPGLYQFVLSKVLRKLLDGVWVEPEELMELLTMCSSDFLTTVEVLAIIVKMINQDFGVSFRNLWRRAWLKDNWEDILRKTETSTDEQIEEMLQGTTLYTVAEVSIKKGISVLSPKEWISQDTAEDILTRYPDLTTSQVHAVFSDLQKENQMVMAGMKNAKMGEAYQKILLMLK
ncbi:hypothetical protein HK098_006035 [Nowakowskiella sp. JEL0407]|nr:hypothetical protein HK098_006035 [Nowakowskiella sp. JEL0407]